MKAINNQNRSNSSNDNQSYEGNNTSDDLIPSYGLLGVFFSFGIQFLIVSSSSFLIYIISKMRQKSATNLLILNQTVADLLNGVLLISLVLVSHFLKSPEIDQLLSFTNAYIVLVSLLCLAALAVYRYKRCRSSLQNCNSQLDTHRGKHLVYIIIGIWATPFCFCLIPLTWSKAPIRVQITAIRIFQGILWMILSGLFVALAVLYILIYIFVNTNLSKHKGGNAHLDSSKNETNTSFSSVNTIFRIDGQDPDKTELRLFSTVNILDDTASSSRKTLPGSLISSVSLRINQGRRKMVLRTKQKIRKREIRMKRLIGILMMLIFASHFPLLLINFDYLFQLDMQLPAWLQTVSFFTFIINSAVSPVLCILMKRDLLQAAKAWIRKIICSNKPKMTG